MKSYDVIEETTYGGEDDGKVEFVVVRLADGQPVYRTESERAAHALRNKLNLPVIAPFTPRK